MSRPARTIRPGGPAERNRLAKVKRIAVKLEKFLGKPRQSAHLPPPLDMLVATVLSQNTNDKNSHQAYTSLRRRFPSWGALEKAPLRSIRSAIRHGGMARTKAPRIKKLLTKVRSLGGGRHTLSWLNGLSDDGAIERLTQLDGVGVKTASCVLLFSLGRDVFPVDTHVHRICRRLALVPRCPNPEMTFQRMRALVPRGKAYSFHTNLIRFGRKICRSNNPSCGICPLFDECTFEGRRRASAPATSRADHNFMLLDSIPR